tara:strand:- start:3091 stop:3201 length:111 start_codon:yes stop_codon:yes gene_type:complete
LRGRATKKGAALSITQAETTKMPATEGGDVVLLPAS